LLPSPSRWRLQAGAVFSDTASTAVASMKVTTMKFARRFCIAALPLLLASCGGGTSNEDKCSVDGQKSWLGDYMNEWYFWTAISPKPNANNFSTVDSYFTALQYITTSPNLDYDRFSRRETDESFNRFFGDGNSLGYGVSVAGLELGSDSSKPLLVRYVEPASPAAAQGLARGDVILAINGRSAADIVAKEDFSALTANKAGDVLSLTLKVGNAERLVSVTAAVFALTPVRNSKVLTTSGGRKLGYLLVNNMVTQALTRFEEAFTQFKAAGVNDVVLDLRYNGGGLVSTGNTLASYIAGTRGSGLNYAKLRYNDKRAATSNFTYAFEQKTSALNLPRVFVLMGRRTCSASEQVINGLIGAGLQVITVGENSCGKPVGFLPTSYCGYTYSVVNFDSVNHRNEGGYFSGLKAACAVPEDFSKTQGAADDPLLASAQFYVDTGRCLAKPLNDVPATTQSARTNADGRPTARALGSEPGEWRGLVTR
jgi:carboxyl-terminal processing protease